MSQQDASRDLAELEAKQTTSDLPVSVRFDGLLEGVIADRKALERSLRALAEVRVPRFEASYEGNHCTLLVEDGVHPGAVFTAAHWQLLQHHLEEVIACFSPQEETETTLRCTERFDDHVRESLFLYDRNGLRLMSRSRTDDTSEPDLIDPFSSKPGPAPLKNRRHGLILLSLFLIAGALIIWHQGLFFRIIPVSITAITTQPGDFTGLIALSTTQSWGTYHVSVERGAQYPTSTAVISERLATAKTLAQRAAINVAVDGGNVFVVLEDATGKALASTTLSLRPLLENAHAPLSCDLPGDGRAHSIRICLSPPEKIE